MKSILYQLAKYAPVLPKQAEVNLQPVLGLEQLREDLFWQLACRIVDPQYAKRDDIWRSAVSRVASMLIDMPESPLGDILFSREILGIYHCYYRHQSQVASEECTDKFFMSFLQRVNPPEYQEQFEKAVDETAKRLAVVRIALATSEDNTLDIVHSVTNPASCGATFARKKKEDKLPFEFRQPAFDYLGINSIAAAADLQDRLTKYATIDQIILGRMGYVMFWSWNNRGQKSNIPLLPAPQKQLSNYSGGLA
jgi:hypothetical protein